MNSEVSISGLRASTEVRTLAHRLNVDLSIVTPSGEDGAITAADVQRVHKILTDLGPLEKLSGARRAMAVNMSQAHAQVAAASVCDDAVLAAWTAGQDLDIRLIRALAAGIRAEPGLNAWYDPHEIGRRVLPKLHLGVAVDTAEGGFIAVLQDVANRSLESLRTGLDNMRVAFARHSVPAEELRGYTITLSNFGRYGGRYASPLILPPTVANVAAGAIREAAVPVKGEVRIARLLPLSVNFDQRCVTGAEAARFLAAMIADLQKAA
jgi:2-oxoisovalerate dehydrogenase E2 component (dihydrolipoyl transacylase)